jgi:hypothetical protein
MRVVCTPHGAGFNAKESVYKWEGQIKASITAASATQDIWVGVRFGADIANPENLTGESFAWTLVTGNIPEDGEMTISASNVLIDQLPDGAVSVYMCLHGGIIPPGAGVTPTTPTNVTWTAFNAGFLLGTPQAYVIELPKTGESVIDYFDTSGNRQYVHSGTSWGQVYGKVDIAATDLPVDPNYGLAAIFHDVAGADLGRTGLVLQSVANYSCDPKVTGSLPDEADSTPNAIRASMTRLLGRAPSTNPLSEGELAQCFALASLPFTNNIFAGETESTVKDAFSLMYHMCILGSEASTIADEFVNYLNTSLGAIPREWNGF